MQYFSCHPSIQGEGNMSGILCFHVFIFMVPEEAESIAQSEVCVLINVYLFPLADVNCLFLVMETLRS